MPDPQIPLEPDEYYHIWTHANGSENLFLKEENYHFFLDKYTYYIQPIVDTFAYCLMPNHLHLMVRVKSEMEVLEFIRGRKNEPTFQGFATLGGFSAVISRQFSHLFNSYTQSYNKVYQRKGSLFVPNFKRKCIQSEKYFTALIAYIHNNPVHHGFTDRPDQWPHSSWHAYVHNKPTKVKKDESLIWFGDVNAFINGHKKLAWGKWAVLFEEFKT